MANEQDPSTPVCVLEVLDANYRELNGLLKHILACQATLAAHCGITLPAKPETGKRVFTTKTAGWGNGNKL